jgi:glutamate 5-kinase
MADIAASSVNTERQAIKNTKRWVIKIGSALLTANGKGLDGDAIAAWTEQIAGLHERGIEVVLVSSGAVAEGVARLGWTSRPHALHELQAAAAVGQMGLIQAYESRFQRFGLKTAQVLLDHDDISSRDRYLNARGTLTTLLGLGVIPVINENDTVVTDEIRFGDNDSLAGLVANLVDADMLVILTDQNGLYETDPRKDTSAILVEQADVADPALDAMAGDSAGQLGRGGMMTKLRAARFAARSGTSTVIAHGQQADILLRIANAESVGTLLLAGKQPIAARKQWLAGMLQTTGTIELDDGAVKVLCHSGKSLLPVGVKSVSGRFKRGDLVVCKNSRGEAVARGLINYDALEAEKIIGQSSEKIEALLGYQGEEELIHRDNLVLV